MFSTSMLPTRAFCWYLIAGCIISLGCGSCSIDQRAAAIVVPDYTDEAPSNHTDGEQRHATQASADSSRRQLQQHDSPKLRDVAAKVGRRCRLTRGTWCGQYERQEPRPTKGPPRGSLTCPKDCNGVGTCDADTGYCGCPAGWSGDDCTTPLKRPCTNVHRSSGMKPQSHIDKDGRDLDWRHHGWLAGRCAGICDDDIATCYCDHPKYGHLRAPTGSPPGTPPIQYGRQLHDTWKPNTDGKGNKLTWGMPHLPYDAIYGADGYCNATHPKSYSGCHLDGFHGINCEIRYEMVCANQCSGHGECYLGFCKCYAGWHGHDCSRKRAGVPMEPSDMASGKALWLSAVTREAPAAADPPLAPTRRRPFIYVYDLPPEFNSRLLQYRVNGIDCVPRKFDERNESVALERNLYGTEMLVHEMMLQSEHRTFDPEEADFFYVPTYVTCLIFPVYFWVDAPMYYGPIEGRTHHASNFLLEAKRWIQAKHPWWNRRQGRDHLWLMLHDEGACWMPTEIYNASIILTHWGRMDLTHKSNTAYEVDNYTRSIKHAEWQPTEWQDTITGHPCYTPGKDIVIPSFKTPQQMERSPLMGAPPLPRDILLFFRGDVGLNRLAWYSRTIRQRLYTLARDNKWDAKHRILIGNLHDPWVKGPYSEMLARSKFALVAPGDGWSGRVEDAILHGAVPVIIMDGVHAVWESILDFDAFSIRVREKSLADLPEILLAVTPDRLARMQRRLQRVWSRFAWASGAFMQGQIAAKLTENLKGKSMLKNFVKADGRAKPRRTLTRLAVQPRFAGRDDEGGLEEDVYRERMRQASSGVSQGPVGAVEGVFDDRDNSRGGAMYDVDDSDAVRDDKGDATYDDGDAVREDESDATYDASVARLQLPDNGTSDLHRGGSSGHDDGTSDPHRGGSCGHDEEGSGTDGERGRSSYAGTDSNSDGSSSSSSSDGNSSSSSSSRSSKSGASRRRALTSDAQQASLEEGDGGAGGPAGDVAHGFRRVRQWPYDEDAFSTLIAWLYSKMPPENN